MGNLEHVAKLGEGVEAWNLWREEYPDVVPDLRGENLSDRVGSNFTGVLFGGADFSGTQFEGADLRSADLRDTKFFKAQLTGVKFMGSTLMGANLQLVTGKGTGFEGANLEGASFHLAHLSGANFYGARLRRTSFHQAQLSGAAFTAAKFGDTSFVLAGLEGANFRGALLPGTSFVAASLEGADIGSADLSDADLRWATGIRFDDTRIFRARLTPQAGPFWQRLLPWAIRSPLTDRWSALRREYTGVNSLIALIAIIALLLPFTLQAAAWRGVNEAQTALGNIAAAQELMIVELAERTGVIGEREELASVAEIYRSAVPELLMTITALTEVEECLAAECQSFTVAQLLVGWHKGATTVVLTLCVLLYGGLRFYVTKNVSALRDEEERSGFTPAWSPVPPQRSVTQRHRVQHPVLRRFRRAVAGYEHLVWLHVLLRILVVLVIVAGLMNWGSVLLLEVKLPVPQG